MSANRREGVMRRRALNCARSASREVSSSLEALPLEVVTVRLLYCACSYGLLNSAGQSSVTWNVGRTAAVVEALIRNRCPSRETTKRLRL